MRVYKFLSAPNALDDLGKRRIRITTIDELNDPFDLTAVDTTDPAVEASVEDLIKWFRKTKGMLCFSGNWDNLLLWSHYAGCHTGICLGFDLPDAQADGGCYLQVSYQPNLLVVQRPADADQKFSVRLLSTKYEVWAYEQEVRLFIQLNGPPDEKGSRWFNFGDGLTLREVIVGAQCSRKNARKAIEFKAGYAGTVELTWACLKKDAFSLVRTPTPPQSLTTAN